jgi:hypothetical protein
MRLDRNTVGRNKYALIKRRVADPQRVEGTQISDIRNDAIDFGDTPDTEFFVIRLKDKYAATALAAYALAAAADGETEYSNDVLNLARRSQNHPHQQKPT